MSRYSITTTEEQDAAIQAACDVSNVGLVEGQEPVLAKDYFEARCLEVADSYVRQYGKVTEADAAKVEAALAEITDPAILEAFAKMRNAVMKG